jgi:hypothetical protein
MRRGEDGVLRQEHHELSIWQHLDRQLARPAVARRACV